MSFTLRGKVLFIQSVHRKFACSIHSQWPMLDTAISINIVGSKLQVCYCNGESKAS